MWGRRFRLPTLQHNYTPVHEPRTSVSGQTIYT